MLGEGHDQAACQGEKALGPLGRVVALEGEAHLHHTPAQQAVADGFQGVVDVQHYLPNGSALEGGGVLGEELPDFTELLVHCKKTAVPQSCHRMAHAGL